MVNTVIQTKLLFWYSLAVLVVYQILPFGFSIPHAEPAASTFDVFVFNLNALHCSLCPAVASPCWGERQSFKEDLRDPFDPHHSVFPWNWKLTITEQRRRGMHSQRHRNSVFWWGFWLYHWTMLLGQSLSKVSHVATDLHCEPLWYLQTFIKLDHQLITNPGQKARAKCLLFYKIKIIKNNKLHLFLLW